MRRALPDAVVTLPVPGGQIVGCNIASGQFAPVEDIRYSAEVLLPNGQRIEFLGEAPLRNLVAPGDRVKPAPIGSPCTALVSKGRAWLIVFGEELEAFDCDQGDAP